MILSIARNAIFYYSYSFSKKHFLKKKKRSQQPVYRTYYYYTVIKMGFHSDRGYFDLPKGNFLNFLTRKQKRKNFHTALV